MQALIGIAENMQCMLNERYPLRSDDLHKSIITRFIHTHTMAESKFECLCLLDWDIISKIAFLRLSQLICIAHKSHIETTYNVYPLSWRKWQAYKHTTSEYTMSETIPRDLKLSFWFHSVLFPHTLLHSFGLVVLWLFAYSVFISSSTFATHLTLTTKIQIASKRKRKRERWVIKKKSSPHSKEFHFIFWTGCWFDVLVFWSIFLDSLSFHW